MDTGAVVAAAESIKNYNGQMRERRNDASKAIQRLRESWRSPAADRAVAKYAKIENDYESARYQVLNQHVAFLYQQVGEGYTETEVSNISLAEQFK